MKFVQLLVLGLGLCWGLVCWGEQGAEVDPGEGYFQRGQFEEAVRTWKAKSSSLSVEQLLSLATAYQQLGRSREALEVFFKEGPKPIIVCDSQNNPGVDKTLKPTERVQVLMQLGELYLGMRVVDRELLADVTKLPGVCSGSKSLLSEGNRERDHTDILIEEAEKCLVESENQLPKDNAWLRANLFNSKGNLLVAKAERKKLEPKYKEALAVYHEGEGLSKEASSGVLAQKEKAKQEAEKALKAYDKTLMAAYEKALREAYEKGEQLANDAGDKFLAAKIAVNIVQVLTEQQKCTEVETKFHKVLSQLKSLPDSPDSHDKAFTLIGLAAQFTPLFTSLLQSSPDVGEKKRCSLTDQKDNPRWSAFNEALRIAKSQGDKTAMAYAYGYLAQLYIEQKRYDEAKQLTNQAIFHTQESADSADLLSAPAQLFRWEWQLGKLFDLQQKGKDAISVYRQAAKHLEMTKKRCGGVSRAFLKEGEDFYYEYAELLRRQCQLIAEKRGGSQECLYFEELTEVIELFKTTQLQNYFYSGCPYDIIENTDQLRKNETRNTTVSFFHEDVESPHPTSTVLSYPFVFANSVAKNLSILEANYLVIPSFKMGVFSSLLVQNISGVAEQSYQQPIPCKEPNQSELNLSTFKFDKRFFESHRNVAVLYLFKTGTKQSPIERRLVSCQKRKLLEWTNEDNRPSSYDALKTEVENFRTAIESVKPLNDLYGIANKLYKWLIEPAIPVLQAQGIDTLVLVTDSALHALPFAALQDEEKKYLIQKYALVVEPAGANLTASEAKPVYDSVLLGGFSKEVTIQGTHFDALIGARGELTNIGQQFTTKETLIDSDQENGVDKSFTIDNLQTRLLDKPYAVVHFATHGVFNEDVDNSYLLTNDAPDKVLSIVNFGKTITESTSNHNNVKGIEEKDQKFLELLTLSACQSAKGGELGFAGIGISVGARSAVGTLWPVNDFSTKTLMEQFYQNLKNGKAKALQNAQTEMLNGKLSADKDFQHPFYWAAFLLTGNWL